MLIDSRSTRLKSEMEVNFLMSQKKTTNDPCSCPGKRREEKQMEGRNSERKIKRVRLRDGKERERDEVVIK